MNILLDTHVFIWWVRNSARLGKQARMLIQDRETRIWVSCASIWEISIKAALGRLDVLDPIVDELPRELEKSGFGLLAVNLDHALAVRALPLHHKDPFDRMLIVQAQCEGLTLMTSDPWMRAYNVRTIDAST